LDSYRGVMEPPILANYHLASVLYFKSLSKFSEMYKNALLYLQYTPLNSIPPQQQIGLAVDVGLAALLGDSIYNFGELLEHSVVRCLSGTEYEWLSRLLEAFNSGDISVAKRILAQTKHDQVRSSQELLNQKIRIMALMELVFKQAGDSRKLTFKQISTVCDLPENQVEFLLMKAFSLRVVRGLIDQVDASVRISWVQPRVLSQLQIGALRQRLKDWSVQVHNVANDLQENAPNLL